LKSFRNNNSRIILTILFFIIGFQVKSQTARSLSFDGIDDYVVVQDHSSNDLITDFTVEVFGKMDTTGWVSLVRKGWCNGSDDAYYLAIRNGKIVWHWATTGPCNVTQNEYISNDSLIAKGQCFKISVVFSSTSIQMYLDNVLIPAQLTIGNHTPINNSSNPLTIGSYRNFSGAYTAFFKGTIHDIRFWNYKLTPSEISNYSNQTLTGNESGLLSYYSFNQGVDGGNNVAVNSLISNTSSGINGNLLNFSLTGSSSNWANDSCSIVSSINTNCNLLNFDGVNDYVEMNSLGTPMAGQSNFTIEFWMKADLNDQTVNRTGMFSINNSLVMNGANRLLIMLGGSVSQSTNIGRLVVADGLPSNDFISNVVIGDNICHHVAYSHNNGTGTVYVDGTNVGTFVSNIQLSASDLYSLGQEWDNPNPSQFYNGDIEDVRVWTTSRTQTQIQANMNNELIGNEPGLLAYYQFNQGTPSANNTTITQAVDKTANNHHGNLNGFALNGSTSNFILNDCISCVVDSCQLGANFSFSGVCLGDTTFFNDLSVDSLGNIVDWKWLFGDGDSLVGVQNPSHLYSASGNYNVTLIITNDSSCTDTISLPLTINPTFNINRNDTICQGDSVLLGGSFQTVAGNYTDSLQTILGCDSVVVTNLTVNPIFSSTQNSTICQGDSILFNGNFYNLAGNYTDSLQTTEGCDSLLNLNLTVNPVFQFNLTQTICQGDSVLLGGSFQTASGIYTDSLQTTLGCDSLIVTTLTVGNVYNDSLSASICQGDSVLLGGSFQTIAGIYTDSLQTILGCDSVVVTTLQVDTIIVLTISDDTVSTPCNPVQLSVSGGSSYVWSPANGLSCVTCPNPIATPETTTTYTVVESSNSCASQASVTVFVEGESDFIIPNVFTPNFDNNNDGFNVKSDCIYSLEKKVYNRWGQLLFHSNQINEPWNGRTTAGAEAPEGTYFYIINVGFYRDGEKVTETHKGTVTLLR